MSEVPFSGEEHGDIVFITGINGFLIPDRATWLDDGGYARLCSGINRIAKREEGIGRHHRTFSSLSSLFCG